MLGYDGCSNAADSTCLDATTATLNIMIAMSLSWAIELGFFPGQTDGPWFAKNQMDPNEPAALAVLRSGRVVAMVGGEEWDVVEDRNDTATLWFRLRKRNEENPVDRRFVKVGPASKAEIRHVKRARRLWAQHEGMNFSLYTVQAKDVLALRGALGKADGRRVFLKLDAEVAAMD